MLFVKSWLKLKDKRSKQLVEYIAWKIYENFKASKSVVIMTKRIFKKKVIFKCRQLFRCYPQVVVGSIWILLCYYVLKFQIYNA